MSLIESTTAGIARGERDEAAREWRMSDGREPSPQWLALAGRKAALAYVDQMVGAGMAEKDAERMRISIEVEEMVFLASVGALAP